jgi:hypothetical protein
LLLVTSVVHGAELLHLIGGEYAGELRPGVLVDAAELLATLVGRETGVGSEGGDFLLAVRENRFELRGLIGRQVELFAELRGFTLRVVGMVVFGCWGGGGVLLLRKGKTARENQSEGGGKQKAVHEWCSLWRLWPLSEGINTPGGECCAARCGCCSSEEINGKQWLPDRFEIRRIEGRTLC